VTGWLATERLDVVKVATPAVRVPVPSEVVPSKNSTVPVGVPAPGALGVTVAVKVTDWPKTDGPGAPVTEVDVAPWFTVWVKAAEVLAVKSVSPS